MNAVLVAAGVYLSVDAIERGYQKRRALERALILSGTKGILNLGSGCDRTMFAREVCELPEVRWNIDKASDCPKCLAVDLESRLPFGEQEFDAIFASHVLEHVENWQDALDEWVRVASNVIIVLPHPLSIFGWLHPDHKQHFGMEEIEAIREHWGAEVFV